MDTEQIQQVNKKLDKSLFVTQVFLILLTAGFGMALCVQLVIAALEVNSNGDLVEDFRQNQLGKFVEIDQNQEATVDPGDIISAKTKEGGSRSCHVHLMVGTAIKWNVADVTVAKKDITVAEYKETIASGGVNDEWENICPANSAYTGDCRYFTKDTWDTQPDSENHNTTYWLFMGAAMLMPFWAVMKFVSLDAHIVDKILNLIFCCKDSKDLFPDLMLDFDWCGSCPKFQKQLQHAAMYLRFKIASNVLLWPLTTLAYNANCPSHLFNAMPEVNMYLTLCILALADLFYLLLLYIVCMCCPSVKTCKVIYLPFWVPLGFSFAGAVIVLMEASFTVILGFRFSLAFNIDVSFSLGMFTGWFMVLSFIEIFAFARKMLGFESKVVEAAVESDKSAA